MGGEVGQARGPEPSSALRRAPSWPRPSGWAHAVHYLASFFSYSLYFSESLSESSVRVGDPSKVTGSQWQECKATGLMGSELPFHDCVSPL